MNKEKRNELMDRIRLSVPEDLPEILEKFFAPKWHPYPEEKPDGTGKYIITFTHEERRGVIVTCNYDGLSKSFLYADRYITAWMHLPEPYKP